MFQVLFVCLGNICRSPMAEGVFQHLVDEAGLSDQIAVDSVGTGSWHVGEPPHRGTRQVLRRHNIDYDHRAQQVTPADLAAADLVVAMDGSNVRDLQRMDRNGSLDGKLVQLLEFGPAGSPRDVPDPYYEGNFEHVFDLVDGACRGLLAHVRQEHGL